MLNCELCDYYKTADFKANSSTICMCEITGFVFHKAVEDYEMENHPCYNYELNAEFEEVKKMSAKELGDKVRKFCKTITD
jgi:hypothetical protein